MRDTAATVSEAVEPQNFTVVNHMTTSWIIVTLARAISIIKVKTIWPRYRVKVALKLRNGGLIFA